MALAILLFGVLAAAPPALADGATDRPAKEKEKARVEAPDAEAEASALAFVRQNHPELADLVASLKPMRPDEYRKAVRELAQVSRTLARLKTNDPARYAPALALWKARSRVELLTARLASAPEPTSEMERQARQAVDDQLDAEIRLQRFDRDRTRERLKKLDDTLSQMESRRDSNAAQRYATLLRQADRARRQAAGPVQTKGRKTQPAATTRRAGADTKPKPEPGPGRAADANTKTSTITDRNPNANRGERQP